MNETYKKIKLFAAGTVILGASFLSAVQTVAQQPDNQGIAADGLLSFKLADMTSHPLAGTEVEIEISGQDALEQTGRSNRVKILLPQRHFRNPLNPPLAIMRRTLALDSLQSSGVAADLDRLILEQKNKITNPDTLESLRTIQKTLSVTKDEKTLDRIVSDMWQVMMQLEEDSFSAAEKHLRDVEKELRESLQKGASGEELRKLMEDSWKAMKEVLGEQAEQFAKDADAKRDFLEMRKMMDEVREMMNEANKTDPEAMQQMMQKMQQMEQDGKNQRQQQQREDMRKMMQEMMQEVQNQKQMQRMAKEIQEMVKKQQALMDKTAKAAKEESEEDMTKVQEQLEKLAEQLKKKIKEQKDDVSKSRFAEGHDSQVALQQLDEMDKDIEGIQKDMEKRKRGSQGQPAEKSKSSQMSKKEARQNLEKLSQIQKLLQQMMQGDPQSPNKQKRQASNQKLGDLAQKMEQQMNQKMQELKDQQQNLQKQLKEMSDKMEQMGKSTALMKGASEDMDEVSQKLDGGEPDGAASDQVDVIQDLEEIGQELAQNMQGPRSSKRGQLGDKQMDMTDPLGRNNSGADLEVNPAKEKNSTRDIRNTLRKRLEEKVLPQAEREYLERLLKGSDSNPAAPRP